MGDPLGICTFLYQPFDVKSNSQFVRLSWNWDQIDYIDHLFFGIAQICWCKFPKGVFSLGTLKRPLKSLTVPLNSSINFSIGEMNNFGKSSKTCYVHILCFSFLRQALDPIFLESFEFRPQMYHRISFYWIDWW